MLDVFLLTIPMFTLSQGSSRFRALAMPSRTGEASGLQRFDTRPIDAPYEKLAAKEQYDHSSSRSHSDAQASIYFNEHPEQSLNPTLSSSARKNQIM